MSSAFENATSMTDFFTVANTVSDGLLAFGFPLVVWVALFGYNVSKGRAEAITYSSFVTGIVLLLENMAGLVDYWVIIADLILLAIGIFMLLMERRQYE